MDQQMSSVKVYILISLYLVPQLQLVQGQLAQRIPQTCVTLSGNKCVFPFTYQVQFLQHKKTQLNPKMWKGLFVKTANKYKKITKDASLKIF